MAVRAPNQPTDWTRVARRRPGSRPIHTAPEQAEQLLIIRVIAGPALVEASRCRRRLLGSLAQARREKPAIPPNHVPRGRLWYIGVVGPCDPHFPSSGHSRQPSHVFSCPETCTRRSNGRGVVDIARWPQYVRCSMHSSVVTRPSPLAESHKKASECRYLPSVADLSSRSAVHTSMLQASSVPAGTLACDPFCSRRAPQAAPGAAGRPGSVGRPRAAARARGVWKCGGRSQRGGARWPASVARNMQAFILAQRPCAHPRSYPPLASPQTSNRR